MNVLPLLFMLVATASYCQTKTIESDMKSNDRDVACKLTTPELQERKRTVIAELKSLVLERDETKNGMKYKFNSSDEIIDLVTSFIKTERLCCDFFDFNLNVGAETGFMWLELSGPKGVKEFINEEIGF
jgi:hypothetical protein